MCDPERIVPLVAEAFGLRIEEMQKRSIGSTARPMAAYLLCKYAGLSQRAAAVHLGYGTGAAVSVQLKRLRVNVQRDTETAGILKQLEDRIADLIEPGKEHI